jgi:hypothetical protein
MENQRTLDLLGELTYRYIFIKDPDPTCEWGRRALNIPIDEIRDTMFDKGYNCHIQAESLKYECVVTDTNTGNRHRQKGMQLGPTIVGAYLRTMAMSNTDLALDLMELDRQAVTN